MIFDPLKDPDILIAREENKIRTILERERQRLQGQLSSLHGMEKERAERRLAEIASRLKELPS